MAATFNSLKVGLNLLGVQLEGTWIPDENEQKAAWEMYVELVTRVSVVEPPAGEGLLRESLTSIYSLFGTTRQILKEHGPSIAQPKRGGDLSFGRIAVTVLNEVLRPVLTKWHPRLEDYEATKPDTRSRLDHEHLWEQNSGLRETLAEARKALEAYTRMLAKAAGVPELTEQGSEAANRRSSRQRRRGKKKD